VGRNKGGRCELVRFRRVRGFSDELSRGPKAAAKLTGLEEKGKGGTKVGARA